MPDLDFEIARLTGSRPSQAALALVERSLLPGERIVGGVAGSTGLASTWHLLTRSTLLILRDGVKAEILFVGLGDLTGYEVQPGWTGLKVILGATSGLLTLGGVDRDAGVQYVYLIERLAQDLLPNSVPASLGPFTQVFEGLMEHVENALSEPEARRLLPRRSAVEVAGDSAAILLSAMLKRSGYVNLDLAEALFLCLLVAKEATELPRGELVRGFINSAADTPQVHIVMAAASLPESTELSACMDALSTLVQAWQGLLSPDAPSEVVTYFRTVRDWLTPIRAEDSTHLEGPPLPPSSMEIQLRGLERLAALRESGAITDDEYEHLKAGILKGP